MNNGDTPINNCVTTFRTGTPEGIEAKKTVFLGLTKREHFAGLAIQGMISSKYYGEFASEFTDSKDRLEGVALAAVRMADALLKELEK